MMKATKLQTHKINHAIDHVSNVLKNLKSICDANGSPLRSVTYRVEDDGGTRLKIQYKGKK